MILKDFNAGFQFFKTVCKRGDRITCISAQGKSNIFTTIVKKSDEKILVIAVFMISISIDRRRYGL